MFTVQIKKGLLGARDFNGDFTKAEGACDIFELVHAKVVAAIFYPANGLLGPTELCGEVFLTPAFGFAGVLYELGYLLQG